MNEFFHSRRPTQWTTQELQQFFRRARRVYQGPELDIRLAPQLYAPWGHLLIVAPRKMGNAVKRNLFKRRIRALFHEEQLSQFGFDIAVFGKPGITTLSYAQLRTLLLEILSSKRAL